MKSYNKLYSSLCSFDNLYLAYKRARKGKTKKDYVIEFEENLFYNLMALHYELKSRTYKPKLLKIFILRDPKTRKISKSNFRDRIVHHALCNIIEPIFDKTFIYDSCANRKGKGNLFAIKRFDKFKKKVSRNGKKLKEIDDNNYVCGYVLKVDIKHYFEEIDQKILLSIVKRKIRDKDVLWLIRKILRNYPYKIIDKGMLLGNLTSQFFANVYLNELDRFVKHKLKARYYIRYVDDFVILHNSKEQLEIRKEEINKFLRERLRLELHPQKTRIIPFSRGVDFVGFRNFYYYKLLRKRNIRNMLFKIEKYKNGEIDKEELFEIFQGWNAYAKWANSYGLRRDIWVKLYKLINNRLPH